MESGSTKASTLSVTGTLTKASVSGGSPTMPYNKSGMNLDVIQEELQVEEGCENELEGQRLTLQMIRQANKY